MNILLTGGTGYIGSHTAVELIEAGHQVTLIDNFSNSRPAVLDRLREITGTDIDFFEIDVRDDSALEDLMGQRSFDAVIHFAAPKAVEESVRRPLHYYQNSVGGTATLCEVLDRHDVRNLVYSSSATVYGMPEQLPVTEESPLSALNPYGRTKLICEYLLEDLQASDTRWNIVSLRYFNPVGAHVSGLIGEDPQGKPANLVPFIAQVAVGRRDELEIFGSDYPTPDGTAIRDYLHVTDLAAGHVAALDYLESEPGFDVINLGTGRGQSVLEMVQAFERASGTGIARRLVDRRPGDAPEVWADVSKAKRVLGWAADRSVDEMCADVWRWQSQNPYGFADPD
ncbi:MAG: UDP-glucose 4-epimerase GalE [Acidimicrobiia bacterium]|nr:UDP-glucose 4-epimerase GalE [Acidimicrobiia bacterium]